MLLLLLLSLNAIEDRSAMAHKVLSSTFVVVVAVVVIAIVQLNEYNCQ
jgi:hypothetical protein